MPRKRHFFRYPLLLSTLWDSKAFILSVSAYSSVIFCRYGGENVELTDLTAYARRTWRLREERCWDEPAGFTVLSAPDSRRWVALLMRQWDTESGCWRECCDIRSGEGPRPAAPWLTAPLRMRGPRWVGVRFTRETEPEAVFRLLDQAVGALAERPPTPDRPVGGGVPDAPHVPTPDRPVGGGVPDAPHVPSTARPAAGGAQESGDGGCGLPRQCAHWLAMTDSEPFPAVGALTERPPTPDRPAAGGGAAGRIRPPPRLGGLSLSL